MRVSVLFVCLGNICRSPAAEGIARALASEYGVELKTDSAGTGAWHVGNPPDPRMRLKCKEHGTPIEDLRARVVTTNDFERFDWILAMDRSNYANLIAMRPAGSRAKVHLMMDFAPEVASEVPDPYYGGPDDFEESYQIAAAGVRAWLQAVQTQNETARA